MARGRIGSVDLRERAVFAYEDGQGTYQEVAERFMIGRTTLCDWVRLSRYAGTLEPVTDRKPPSNRLLDDACLAQLRALVDETPDATRMELAEAYCAVTGRALSVSSVGRALKQLGLTWKKKTCWATERDTERIRRRRERFLRWIARVNPNQIVCLDEAGSTIAMTRTHALAPRGERAHDHIPRCRGTVTTMIGAMTLEGMTAMMTIEGGTCAEVFRTFVEELLVPTLEPGDYVILDNLGAHRSKRALEAIRRAGATPVFLPPYSPELNPIELAWSKLKQLLRDAKARTREALDEAIAHAMSCISVSDAYGWFGHCGYAVELA